MPFDKDNFDKNSDTGRAWLLLSAHFKMYKEKLTKYPGLASFVLNKALRDMNPNVNPQEACKPIVEAGLVTIRPSKNCVIYYEGNTSNEDSDNLLKAAGLK